MPNSKAKGKRGELEIARAIEEAFPMVEMRRGQQYNGSDGSADVVGFPGLHIECKRTERLRISEAVAQATEDAAKTGEVPVVVFKANRQKPMVIIPLDQLPAAAVAIYLAMVEGS